jgi:uncharacterized protein YndB with AHSA1/START domain
MLRPYEQCNFKDGPASYNTLMNPQYTVEVRRRIAASPQRVYDAWLTPADWDSWFTNNSQIDARVGGKYVNGDHDTGTYLELVPPGSGAGVPAREMSAGTEARPTGVIRFTWDNPQACPGSEVMITFTPVPVDSGAEAGATDVLLRHTKLPKPETGRGEMIDGWGWALDNLAAYLEGGEKMDHDAWVARKYGD